METAIIQEKIFPPENETYIIRDGKLTKEKCISEFGIYGIIISDENTVHLNRSARYVVRTKLAITNEGGVVSGGSAIDTPNLVEG